MPQFEQRLLDLSKQVSVLKSAQCANLSLTTPFETLAKPGVVLTTKEVGLSVPEFVHSVVKVEGRPCCLCEQIAFSLVD